MAVHGVVAGAFVLFRLKTMVIGREQSVALGAEWAGERKLRLSPQAEFGEWNGSFPRKRHSDGSGSFRVERNPCNCL